MQILINPIFQNQKNHKNKVYSDLDRLILNLRNQSQFFK